MNNLPTVAVHDIAIHPRERDLIIGTHGRGIWVLDDISFLREMSEDVLLSDFHLFGARPAVFLWTSIRGESFAKPGFLGKNPAVGAHVTAWIKVDLKEKVRVAIKDASGKTVTEQEMEPRAGLQRIVWNLQFVPEASDGKKYLPAAALFGALPIVPTGKYTAELSIRGTVHRSDFEVAHDKRAGALPADAWEAHYRAIGDVNKASRKLGLAITAVKNVRRHVDSIMPEIAKMGERAAPARTALAPFLQILSRIEDSIVPGDFLPTQGSLDSALRGGSLSIRLTTLGIGVAAFPSAPSATDIAEISDLSRVLDASVGELTALIATEVPMLNKVFVELGLKPFPSIAPVTP
jgi:hypothetical protein